MVVARSRLRRPIRRGRKAKIPQRASRQSLSPSHPRAAELFLGQALRGVARQLERAILDVVEPHIAAFSDPEPEARTDAAADGSVPPGKDPEGVIAAIQKVVDDVLARTKPKVVSAGQTAGDRIEEHSKREFERLGLSQGKVRFVPHPKEARHETTVMVDVKALDGAWVKDGGYYIPPGGGGGEIGGRRHHFAAFLQKGEPIQASKVTVDPETGIAAFTDGRHRFSVLRDMGVERVAITIPKDDLRKLPKEWNATKVGDRAPTPPVAVDLLQDEPELEPKIRKWRDENANRIVSLSEQKVDQVRELLENKAGMRVESLRDAIKESVGTTKRQAELIARDQVLKINSQITESRHKSVGIAEYIWTCSGDERVRGRPDGLYPDSKPSHWALDGKRFKWSEPPVSGPRGERGHPGTMFQCRCTAYPVLPELEALGLG